MRPPPGGTSPAGSAETVKSKKGIAPAADRLPILVVVGLMAGPFLSMVDANIINVAIPSIAKELHASLPTAQWTLSGYLLAMAIALPATSYLARRHGTQRVYRWSLVAFVLTSAACAAAPTIIVLDATRALQGLTAAPLVPLSMALMFHRADGNPDKNQSWLGSVLLFLAPALGPTIGGLLLDVSDWRTLFLVNVPIGVVALIGTHRLAAHMPAEQPDQTAQLDTFGLTVLAGALGAFLYAVAEAPTAGWLSPTIWPFEVLGALGLVVYVLRSRTQAHPPVALDLLRSRRNALTVGICTLTAVVLFAVLFLLPVFLQEIDGATPVAAGLVLLPQGIAMGISTLAGNALARRLPIRRLVVFGLLVLWATTALLLLVDTGTPMWVTALMLMGRGFAIGFVITPLINGLLLPLPPARMPDGTTLFNIAQRVGASVGIAAIASVFAASVRSHIALAEAHARATGVVADKQVLAAGASAGFHETILVVVAAVVPALLAAVSLPTVRLDEHLAVANGTRATPQPGPAFD